MSLDSKKTQALIDFDDTHNVIQHYHLCGWSQISSNANKRFHVGRYDIASVYDCYFAVIAVQIGKNFISRRKKSIDFSQMIPMRD